eukprot:CAMPEP_0202018290 /NCGR_PEP_ID=MMETSP0905-20130828/39131_1 /ASSEMBLY_ACC=CAM_ASM_000554 /TAXON_ID=420261 /ORGANISM="Thalassiosira antarctica, Strain CCMP982" /LENGTH=368 /DNA_ID=CAMNT_0048579195 /DNA_START=26 /DNA_END=1132 /DNA_ORIENTATION=+
MLRNNRKKAVPSTSLFLPDEKKSYSFKRRMWVELTSMIGQQAFAIQFSSLMVIATLIFMSIRPSALSTKHSTSQLVPNTNGTKTTIVLMGYYSERTSNYHQIFEAYSQMDLLIDQVLFLWNNLDEPIPPIPNSLAQAKVPIIPLQQSRNSMNNRFGVDVTQRVRTSSVLLVDDDVVLSSGMIQAMIEGWVQSDSNPMKRPMIGVQNDARIVGEGQYFFHCSRIEGWFFLQPNCWRWPFRGTSVKTTPYRQNLVIGKTMLFSRTNLRLYQNDESISNFAESHFCEDVLMNALVRNVTHRKDPVYIVEKSQYTRGGSLPITRSTLNEQGGLSRVTINSLLGSWVRQRRECVKFSEEYFGTDIWKSRVSSA